MAWGIFKLFDIALVYHIPKDQDQLIGRAFNNWHGGIVIGLWDTLAK